MTTTLYVPMAQNIKTQDFFQVKHLTDDTLTKDYVRYNSRTRLNNWYYSSLNRTKLSYELFFLDYPEKANWEEFNYGIMIIEENTKPVFIPILPEGEWLGEDVKGWSKIKE